MGTVIRTCVGCGRQRPQQELLRFTRRADGQVILRAGRIGAGRSAYVCWNMACFDQALARRALQRSLARAGSVRLAAADLRERTRHLLEPEGVH